MPHDRLNSDPDMYLNVSQLILSKGYLVEEHQVVTEDGFVLALQRVSSPKWRSKVHTAFSQANATPRPVAFLQHGLLDSAAAWVLNFPKQSLAFILADAGIDVWLGNSRGNTYSRKNIHLNPADPTFWNWTWDELAKYDVPAVIDYVLGVTKAQKLSWVGHSRGTQMMFAALPGNAALAAKLNVFVALAPVAYLGNLGSYLMRFLALTDTSDLLDRIGFHEFLPGNTSLSYYFPELCAIWPNSCDDLGDMLFGCCEGDTSMNQTRMPVYWAHIPAGTSCKEMAHYAQAVSSGLDQMYDYGVAGNMQQYNQSTPPAYNVSTIPLGLPIALFSGGNDVLADPTDVTTLANLLGSRVVLWNVQPDYTHIDFTWGLRSHTDIYPKVLNLIRTYSQP